MPLSSDDHRGSPVSMALKVNIIFEKYIISVTKEEDNVRGEPCCL